MKIRGQDNIKALLLNILEDNDSKELYSILVWKPIVYYFGDQFAEKFMQMRVEKDIYLKSLRVTEENFDSDKHKDYNWYNKEIKHVSSYIFNKSIFLFDKKVLIFDMKNMECEYIENENQFLEYLEKFNNLWNS